MAVRVSPMPMNCGTAFAFAVGVCACETERGVVGVLNQPADCCQGWCVAMLLALFITSLRSPGWEGICK